ncbi:hypothetical protein P154DRAFT_576442 [Amniculicola lignicola CBS 123094]|uniref:Uncharacterized protein n=1 Tax=Amniculicola lignicola CBS 123094 TaxID=1392246 RepID=A0A6A5WEQ9_9PLEO|nr:hypothetical protein P154DRAFT_576442 [Amniculicola lignicola CBS 123094]
MARIPRRTHSVSGPPSVHCVMKDVACCCNIISIHQFYMSMMELRRNPQRKCKKEEAPPNQQAPEVGTEEIKAEQQPATVPQNIQRRPTPRRHLLSDAGPFRFCDLPREVRDQVYSYLVVRRGRKVPIIESRAILRNQKKRAATQRTRERLNQKRVLSGKRPIIARDTASEPIIFPGVLQSSRQLQVEASDHLYQNNWFSISLESYSPIVIDAPLGWDFSRITKLQLELQLKDSQRMNNFIDWSSFFASFPALRFLRIIPTFNSRYYDWAHTELETWTTAHFVFRGFFRELLASVPGTTQLKLGPSLDPLDDMHLEGRAPNEDEERPSSSNSTTSILSAGDWRKIERLLRQVVSDIYDKRSQQLSQTIHSISVRNVLLVNEVEQLKEALVNEKKKRQRGKPLLLEAPPQYDSGAIFWSPQKVQEARARQVKKDAEEEALQHQKDFKKVQRAEKKAEKACMLEERKRS